MKVSPGNRPTIDSYLRALGVAGGHVVALKDVPAENASWLVQREEQEPVVLRRYHPRATRPDVTYEHEVLRHVAAQGWTVPEPLTAIVEVDDSLHCLTRYVSGAPRRLETPADRAQRGRDLARLQLALRPLTDDLGQRPLWRPQHTAVTVHVDIDWPRCLEGLRAVDQRLADWAEAAAGTTTAAPGELGATDLPVTMVHGDFAAWNVNYDAGDLVGVIDFGLSHVDSRPYELAIARLEELNSLWRGACVSGSGCAGAGRRCARCRGGSCR